jgi:hypothetical protein
MKALTHLEHIWLKPRDLSCNLYIKAYINFFCKSICDKTEAVQVGARVNGKVSQDNSVQSDSYQVMLATLLHKAYTRLSRNKCK